MDHANKSLYDRTEKAFNNFLPSISKHSENRAIETMPGHEAVEAGVIDWIKDAVGGALKKVKTLVTRDKERVRDTLDSGKGVAQTVQEILKEKEAEEIERGRRRGMTRDELTRAVDEVWKGTGNLKRVVRTESMEVYLRAQLTQWKSMGVEKVRWRIIRDGRACELCQSLDTNIYKIDDLLRKKYIHSDSHPNCRCTFEPVISFDDSAIDKLQKPIKFVPVKVTVKKSNVEIPQESQNDVRNYLNAIPVKTSVKYVANISTSPEYLSHVKSKFKGKGKAFIDKYILEHSDLTRVELPDVVLISTRKNQTSPISESLGRESGSDSWRQLNLNQKTRVGDLWTASQEKVTYVDNVKTLVGLGYLDDIMEKNSKMYFVQAYSYYVSNPGRLLAYNRDLYDFIKDEIFNGRDFLARGGVK